MPMLDIKEVCWGQIPSFSCPWLPVQLGALDSHVHQNTTSVLLGKHVYKCFGLMGYRIFLGSLCIISQSESLAMISEHFQEDT